MIVISSISVSSDMFIDMPYDPDALSWLLNIKAKEGEFIICKEYNENGGKLNVICKYRDRRLLQLSI